MFGLAVEQLHLLFLLQIWAEKFSELLPRAVLVAGDIFNSKLIPAPPADSANTAYVLYDILHNVSPAIAAGHNH